MSILEPEVGSFMALPGVRILSTHGPGDGLMVKVPLRASEISSLTPVY